MTTTRVQAGVCNVPNRTIFEGDNLDVMRGINDACIDLIYLDPPFNSNRDYAAPIGSKAAGAAFKDTWDLTDVDEAWHNQIAETDLPLYKIIDASQYSHGNGMKSYLIMMAVRLLEMKRILKPTGSIYLHCDATASHYLKALMDAVFGRDNFRNEIVWKRKNAKGLTSTGYARNHDLILYYSNGPNFVWNPVYLQLSPEYVEKNYRHREPGTDRRYRLDDLTNPARNRPNLTYEFLGVTRVWRWTRERMQKAYDEGLVVQSRPGGVPRQKRYLDESRGTSADTIWIDVNAVQSQSKERTGYPTQKPLALLERIIKASSNEGDVVLDPFCGCATTCIAAERLNRQWIGIDLSPLAVKLVEQRARNELGLMGGIQSNARTDIPMRTDREPEPPLSESKLVLYGAQGGNCNGCGTHFLPQHLTVDHIIARSKGGTGHLDNLQLLCGHCNSLKGNRPMEYLRARLVRAV